MNDFDFLFGTWNVHNRRLRNPLSDSSDWYEFESTATEAPLLGGMANLEQYDAEETPNGPIHAIALRLFDQASSRWGIYWSTAGSGSFLVPTIGTFANGIGTFLASEELAARSILVRFIWTPETTSSCRWEQAFSSDDGATWETNWIMNFTRVSV
jgi:hypothetical protein